MSTWTNPLYPNGIVGLPGQPGGPAAPAFDYSSLLNSAPTFATPNYNNNYAANGVDWSQSAPNYADTQDRALFGNTGQQQLQDYSSEEQYQDQLQNTYQQAMNQSYGALAQTPGYTSDQIASFGPSAGQQSQMNQVNSETSAIDPSVLTNPINSAYGAQTSALGQEQGQVGNALGQEQNSYSQYLNPQQLSLNLNPNYQMSDNEVNQITSSAAQGAQQQRQSALNGIQQQAMASGSYDPLAMGALTNRYEQAANVEGQNAATNANIAATDAQRQTEMNAAQANLSANQAYAGMGMNAAQNLAGQNINAAQTLGSQGLNAAQWQGSTLTGANTNMMNAYEQALQNQYNAGMGQYQTQLGVNQNVANTALSGQQQFRNWAAGQTQNATGASQGWGSLANSATSNMNNGINQAAANWGNFNTAQNAASFGAQAASGLGKGLGSILNPSNYIKPVSIG